MPEFSQGALVRDRILVWSSAFLLCMILAGATWKFLDRLHDEAQSKAFGTLNLTADFAVALFDPAALQLGAAGAPPFLRSGELERLQSMSGHSIVIADAQGRIVSGPASLEPVSRAVAARSPPGPGAMIDLTLGEQDFCIALRALPGVASGPPWRLMVIADEDRLLHEYRKDRGIIVSHGMAIFVLLLGMAGLLSWYLGSRARFSQQLLSSESRLQRSQSHLVEAQRIARTGSWEMRLDGTQFTGSKEYFEIFQVNQAKPATTLDEFVSRFLVDPAEIAAALENKRQVMNGEAVEGVRHIRLDDGSRKWVQFRTEPIRGADGKVASVRGVVRDITAERQAQAAIEARTAELEQAKEIAGLGTWLYDVSSGVLTSCEHMKRIYETTERDHPRSLREWAERLMPVEDQAEFWPLLEENFHGQPFERERRIITALGKSRWIRTIARPEFDAAGQLIRYRGVTLDITPYRAALEELAARTMQLSQAQQIGRMGSWHWDIASDRLSISDQHHAIYELPEEYRPGTFAEWLERFGDAAEREDALAQLARLRNGEAIEGQRRVVTAKGNRRWIHVSAQPIRDAAGRVIAAQGVTRDITTEKKREDALHETTRQLEEAHRIARMCHYRWDLATDRLVGYGEYERVFGLTAEIRFNSFREWAERFCHPDDLGAVKENRRMTIEAGKPYHTQRRTRMPDGSYRWIELIGEPIFDASGRLVAYRGVARDIHEQKIAELRLAESEAKFRLISEHMTDHVALHDAAGTLLYSSPSSKTLFGYSAARSVGTSPFDNIHADDLDRVRRTLGEFAASAASASVKIEFRFRHRAGHYLWLESVIAPVRDEQGRLIHFQSSSRDVTAQRIATELLRESEARFRTLTEVSSDWYWETDALHRISFLSAERSEGGELQRGAILGRTRWELFPDALGEAEWADHRHALEAHQPFLGTVFCFASGARVAFASISGRPIFDAHGAFRGYRGIGRDITRIKLAEQQLAESEQRFRHIAQNMRDVVSLHDSSSAVRYVSPSFSTITGYPVESVPALSWRRLVLREDYRATVNGFAAVVRGDTSPATLVFRIRNASGHLLWLEAHLTRVAGNPQSPSQVQVVARDITARREAELQLKRRGAELARLNRRLAEEVRERQELERNVLMTIEMELAQVGLELHDQLGQDLTGISLLAKTLENRLKDKSPEGASHAARIAELVNRAIRHTRMISHGLSPYIWGRDGLVAALAQLAADINALGIVEVRTRFDADIEIRDELVARSFYRIAQESANNALKHGRAHLIKLSLSRRAPGLELRIEDDGVGGIAADSAETSGASSSRFHSLRHRCGVIGASLTIRHGRNGGTTVRVSWRDDPRTIAAGTAAEENG
ncbi:MAG TPA: PAS domain S-box protein [Usitatibacteraceae bacterium]|nr:PAS domain S-box protein [Usitatibacteraceae bacterium]